MSSKKYEGSSYPTHFLKIRGSTITNNFLKGRAKKAVQLLRDEMIIMVYSCFSHFLIFR